MTCTHMGTQLFFYGDYYRCACGRAVRFIEGRAVEIIPRELALDDLKRFIAQKENES